MSLFLSLTIMTVIVMPFRGFLHRSLPSFVLVAVVFDDNNDDDICDDGCDGDDDDASSLFPQHFFFIRLMVVGMNMIMMMPF